jgi:hypothetical protein
VLARSAHAAFPCVTPVYLGTRLALNASFTRA